MRCSVIHTTWSPSSLKATLLTAVGNSQVYRHFPVCTDHSLNVLSAAPDTKYFVSADEISNQNHDVWEGRVYAPSTSTVHTDPLCPSYVPNRSPLWENQTLMTWSFEHEKSRSPSLLNLICVSDRSWPKSASDKSQGQDGHNNLVVVLASISQLLVLYNTGFSMYLPFCEVQRRSSQ